MGNGKWVTPACILTFCLCAVGAWFDGQQSAAYLFACLVGFFLLLAVYARYRRKITPDSGPIDPSNDWHSDGEASAGEVGTFRYSPGTLLFVRGFAWLSTLLVPVIYVLSSPRPTGLQLIGLVLFGVTVFAGCYAGFLACNAFSIDVQAGAVVVNKLIKSRTYKFSSMGMVALLDCGGGRGPKYVLALYDKANRALWQIDTGIDEFEQFVALMKKRCFEEGVSYRYRDKWGCWTK